MCFPECRSDGQGGKPRTGALDHTAFRRGGNCSGPDVSQFPLSVPVLVLAAGAPLQAQDEDKGIDYKATQRHWVEISAEEAARPLVVGGGWQCRPRSCSAWREGGEGLQGLRLEAQSAACSECCGSVTGSDGFSLLCPLDKA